MCSFKNVNGDRNHSKVGQAWETIFRHLDDKGAADENPVLKEITALIPNPNQRRKLLSIAGYPSTMVFLAGTSFNQLYLENAPFRSGELRNYFALSEFANRLSAGSPKMALRSPSIL